MSSVSVVGSQSATPRLEVVGDGARVRHVQSAREMVYLRKRGKCSPLREARSECHTSRLSPCIANTVAMSV